MRQLQDVDLHLGLAPDTQQVGELQSLQDLVAARVASLRLAFDLSQQHQARQVGTDLSA